MLQESSNTPAEYQANTPAELAVFYSFIKRKGYQMQMLIRFAVKPFIFKLLSKAKD